MEVLGVRAFADAYNGRRVLVTGHTGFKGSWLSLWLNSLGADVIGLALAPETSPSHWEQLKLPIADHRVDVRDEGTVRTVIARERPEIVFHLAAQPLVRRSYREPLATWSTNVMGTAHVLDAIRRTQDVRAVVVVTSDKCYQNQEWPWAYRERDRLGGRDPYSASKAGAELVAASYRESFLKHPGAALLATARGGNVIGGGDWSEDRLIPDLVRSAIARTPLVIRSAAATRPWQHVLDCLSGYLLLGQRLLAGDAAVADAWNFGPDVQGNRTVEDVLREFNVTWPQLTRNSECDRQTGEAGLLQLDSAKAQMDLRWRPVWNFETAIRLTADWYRVWLETGTISSMQQLAMFLADAEKANLNWAGAEK